MVLLWSNCSVRVILGEEMDVLETTAFSASMVGDRGECQKENVLYEITCLQCKQEHLVSSYVGESTRTGHRRGDNHVKDLLNKREGKPLWEHSKEFHEGKLKEEDFKMVVTRRFKTPLQRQIGEALEIERKRWKNDLLLNSKSEWNGTKMPRLRLASVEEESERKGDE